MQHFFSKKLKFFAAGGKSRPPQYFTKFKSYTPNLATLSFIPGPIVVAITQDLIY